MSWRNRLVKKQILLEGPYHFVGSLQDAAPDKCLHFSTYTRPEMIATTPGLLGKIGKEFAKCLDPSVDCVVAVGIESVALGTETAARLNLPSCFLSNQFRFRDSFKPIVHQGNVALVATTIVGSHVISQASRAVRGLRGKVTQVLTVVDHSELSHKIKTTSLVKEGNQKLTLEGCLDHGPCSKGVPIKRQPGKGSELEKMYRDNKVNLPEGATLSFV